MNIAVTSKEAILSECRKLVMEQGLSSVNMRNVANLCGVAVGSIYNYFPSKSALISAAVEDVWRDIFHMAEKPLEFVHFTDCLEWLFDSVKKGCEKYPGFFTLHSMSFAAHDKSDGRKLMEQYFCHMKESLLEVLMNDSRVRSNAFDEKLNAEEFVDIIFTMITSMLLEGREDCSMILEIVARCIY